MAGSEASLQAELQAAVSRQQGGVEPCCFWMVPGSGHELKDADAQTTPEGGGDVLIVQAGRSPQILCGLPLLARPWTRRLRRHCRLEAWCCACGTLGRLSWLPPLRLIRLACIRGLARCTHWLCRQIRRRLCNICENPSWPCVIAERYNL